MTKSVKSIISIALVLITILSTFAVTASAASTTAFDILTTSKYAKTYTLASSGKTIPYTSKNLNKRGTVTYGASSTSYIDNKSDEIYIMDVGCTGGKYWAYVSYPTSSRRVNAYINLSAVTKNNGSHKKVNSTGKFYCSLRENSSNSSSYYVAKNDTVYLVATSSSKYQILYPISGGWRLAWCNKSDYQKYCTTTPAPKNTSNKLRSPVPSGCYFNKKTSDNGWYGYHDINIGVSTSTPVYAITNGTATFKQSYAVIGGKKYLISYGNYVEFKSADGVYKVILAHLNRFNGVDQIISSSMTKQMGSGTARNKGYSVGTYTRATKNVSAGQILGYIGTTGNSTGNHLHIEVYKNGTRVDPTTVFSGLTR